MAKMRLKNKKLNRFNPRTTQGDRYVLPDVRLPLAARARTGCVRTVAEVARELQLERMILGPR